MKLSQLANDIWHQCRTHLSQQSYNLAEEALERALEQDHVTFEEYSWMLNQCHPPTATGKIPTTSLGQSMMIPLKGLKAFPAKQFVISRFEITNKTFALLCATGSSGKTMFAQYIACCISSGKPLFGSFEVQQGKVIHIDQEQSETQTCLRYERLASALSLTSLNIERLTLTTRLDSKLLNPKATEQELTTLLKGARLCIIDSLKGVSESDENSADIEPLLKMLKRVSETTECAILLIHHKGKGRDAKQSGRGHSSIYDSVDIQIDLESDNGAFTGRCKKNRDGREFPGWSHMMDDLGEYIPEQKCKSELHLRLVEEEIAVQKDDRRLAVLHLLNDKGEMKHGDLYDIVKGDRENFNQLLGKMLLANEITERKEGKSRMFAITINGQWEVAA